ncbi:hypothetical protein L1275_000139 [Flavobacterium sp. HSC-61S13]|nr:hypothetical protein [Flavobacterium sp. HSC-61S13]
MVVCGVSWHIESILLEVDNDYVVIQKALSSITKRFFV